MSESRYTPNDQKEYAKYIALGHRLRLEEDGRVAYFESGETHGGPWCDICNESWCMHCPDPIAKCIGEEKAAARKSKLDAENKRRKDSLAAWDNIAALQARIDELRRA